MEFPNREIRWIIPYSPGGGFDTYSRAIANRMPQYLPNSVNILAENVTGAGGRRGANETYRADPNGYTIGIWNMPGMIAAQVVRETEYDTTEVSWIGRIVQEPYALFAPADGPIQSVEDLENANEELGRPLRVAGTGPGSTGSLVSILALNAIDVDFEFVFGFAGTQEMAAATLRGETDLYHTSIGSSTAKSFTEGEDGQAIMYYGGDDIRPDWLEGVPKAEDVGYESIQGILANHRMVGGPPGIPEERRSVLESAFLDTVQSDEFSEWAEGAGRPIGPVLNGEETLEVVQGLRDTMEENRDVISEYLGS
jgi:tripartite-type tricarboxylate transporter receptor subunit TctC